MLQCFVCSPIPKVSEKKGATGQSFIRKEITTLRIGTYFRYLQFPRNLSEKGIGPIKNNIFSDMYWKHLNISSFRFSDIFSQEFNVHQGQTSSSSRPPSEL